MRSDRKPRRSRRANAAGRVRGAAILVLSVLTLSCSPPPKPNVVIVLLDTVRADRLSCYGYDRPTTPSIDALASRGVLFENASSTSSWTVPAHASLFTGAHPIAHGATQEQHRLGTDLPTLAEQLTAAGYATFAASANPLVSTQTGLARGFQQFEEKWRRSPASGPPERHPNLAATRRFLASLPPDQPAFLFLNFIEAHSPYAPPEPHRSRFLDPATDPKTVRAAQRRSAVDHYLEPSQISEAEHRAARELYDGEVARLDELVAALVAMLERSGRLDQTLLWITSDHGENFGDHGHLRHVFSLYRTTVHVPLIALLPGGARAGERRPEPVSLVDVYSTIMAWTGLGLSGGGRDILAAGDALEERTIFAEYYYPLQALGLFTPEQRVQAETALAPHRRRLRSAERDGLRLIWSSDGRNELYDLRADPDEGTDRSDDPARSDEAAALRESLAAFVAAGGGERPLPAGVEPGLAPDTSDGGFDAETVERLRELGYLR